MHKTRPNAVEAEINIGTTELPLVSIITVVLNGERHLAQTIASVHTQSWPHIEYIVIDGGSTDGTLDIINSCAQQIDFWCSEPDLGIFDAMNKGIALAKGELIGLLNADDWYEPDAVATAVATFQQNGCHGIYYGERYLVQPDMAKTYETSSSLEFWRGMTISHQAMFVHRAVYDRIGKYDISYRLAADYDFLLRAVQAQIPLVRLNRYIVNFRATGASAQSLLLGNREISAILKKQYGAASTEYLKNLLLTGYNLTAVAVGHGIGRLFGKRVRQTARKSYYALLAGRREKIEP